MFKLKFKTIAITAVIASLLLIGFVVKSEAIEIVEFPSDTEDYSYGGATYHTAYVKTDNPIYHVSWYIDGEHVHGETLDSSTSEAYFYPINSIPGEISGKDYEISVTVWEWDAEDEEFYSTSDSYTVKMWEGETDWLEPKHTETSGYAEAHKLYYDPAATVTWDDWFNEPVNWKGTANSEGAIYFVNHSDDTSYDYDWVARLAILGYGRDEKDGDSGRIGPGQTVSLSPGPSLAVDRTGAPRGEEHTMEVVYNFNIYKTRNLFDSCEVRPTYDFDHNPDE